MNPTPKPVRREKARKPLRRTRIKRKPARRLTRPGPGRDEAYLEAVRKLPCMIADGGACEGDVVAHHAGPKKNDSTCVPLCWKHHQNWHDARGPFVGLDKENRRTWAAVAIELTRARTQGERQP